MKVIKHMTSFFQLFIATFLLIIEYFARITVATVMQFFSCDILKGINFIFFSRTSTEKDTDCDRSSSELIESKGYICENHYCETEDGWILGLHRVLGVRDGEKTENPKNVVLIMHGFLQSSEAWLVHKNPREGLPYILVENGFDVWLGNNRGNTYSHKHRKYSPDSVEYWDFSIDDFIRYDLPTMINYIIGITRCDKISYIGFSQGTAQGFGAFSIDQKLAERISIFIALAPTVKVRGFSHNFVNTMISLKPEVCYLIFGRKSFLSSALFWRRIFSRRLYSYVMILSNYWLFGWTSQNISLEEKDVFYNHIYSYTSVKVVVHWFQIQQSRIFQMYDDAQHHRNSQYKPYHTPVYDVSMIKCPVALFYGGSDGLPNFEYLLQNLKPVHTEKISDYEHLCFMWAKNAHKTTFQKIIKLLKEHKKNGFFIRVGNNDTRSKSNIRRQFLQG